ncbi:MAG: hypothetical protein ACYTBP_03600 [Planctomycetota bacterium]|jgi:hypothetical protein
MFNVTEQPWTIVGIAVFSAIVIWIIQAVTPQKKKLWMWFIPIIIALAGLATDYFVQSDAEKIRTTIKQAVKAVEIENIDQLKPLIAEAYSDSFHRSKKALLDNFKSRLTEPTFQKTIPGIVQININPQADNATVRLNVRVIFEETNFVARTYKQRFETKLELTLVKQSQDWLISSVELVKLDFQPMQWNGVQNVDW